ncbi:MAG: glycosyltransferase, partial [Halothiobacillaceae bacterium]
MRDSPAKLLIVSHVVHYTHGGRLHAYGPYAREIEIWADLFPAVIIAAPCRHEPPPGDCEPFTRPNISIMPQRETGGTTLKAKLHQAFSLPFLIRDLARAMRRADAIHVRCPGSLGLLGAAMARCFSPFRIAKYAGQWNGYPGEPWTVRLQRMVLRSWWWGAPVTVYGHWPGQPEHVIPFFTSVLTADQIERARTSAQNKTFRQPLRILYVGRLSRSKHVDTLISSVSRLRATGIPAMCTIVGDGEMRPALERQARELNLARDVLFAGGVEFERVLEFYEQSDVLVLVSETEGWPKAIAEGMAFGLVCIGSDRGLVPQMLGDGRGIVVPPGDVDALTIALKEIASCPEKYRDMSARASAWAQQYSLESLRGALR